VRELKPALLWRAGFCGRILDRPEDEFEAEVPPGKLDELGLLGIVLSEFP
jgi:hypothetical protein